MDAQSLLSSAVVCAPDKAPLPVVAATVVAATVVAATVEAVTVGAVTVGAAREPPSERVSTRPYTDLNRGSRRGGNRRGGSRAAQRAHPDAPLH